jgi:hypothetical protein
MDESVTLLGTFRSGRVGAKLWKIVEFDAQGSPSDVGLVLELSNGPPVGNVALALQDLPQLASVLAQALASASDHAGESLGINLAELIAAARGPLSISLPN